MSALWAKGFWDSTQKPSGNFCWLNVPVICGTCHPLPFSCAVICMSRVLLEDHDIWLQSFYLQHPTVMSPIIPTHPETSPQNKAKPSFPTFFRPPQKKGPQKISVDFRRYWRFWADGTPRGQGQCWRLASKGRDLCALENMLETKTMSNNKKNTRRT